MKILQISSLWETTPPPKYGGLELVVSNLTEELVKRGHDVTLFATGDSKTKAKLKSTYPRALYRDKVTWTSMYDTLTHLAEALRFAEQWGADVIHNHLSHRALAISSLTKIPMVFTIHGTLEVAMLPEDRLRAFHHYRSYNYVSISDFQRRNAPKLNWIRTVYNGIDPSRFDHNETPRGDYLVWVGRFTPTKGVHLAIDIAQRLGKKLLMAAKLDHNAPADLEYFEQQIKPHLKKGQIEWVGEIGHADKVKLLKDARVFLNPILWDEPFGLVTPEANLCGTPVVAFNRGSMPELIRNNVNGVLVKRDDVGAMTREVSRLLELPTNELIALRLASRQWAESHFSVERMVDGYLAAYQQAINSRS